MHMIEFREMWTLNGGGNVAGRRWEYRRRTITIGLLGAITVSDWGEWEQFNITIATEPA